MNKIIYFDHAATTKVDERVLSKMLSFFSVSYGNPSSLYSIGRQNKRAIEQARLQVAEILGCKKKEIYFTSGGTESDNLALKGIAYANKNKGKHIITSKIEHPAILNTCKTLEKQGYKVTYMNVDKKGRVALEELESVIREDTILISIMMANNEIGTIQPIKEIARICKNHGIYFHTDAVQAMGNIRVNIKDLGVDALSMSAHKFYGPKGMGVLYVKEGISFDSIQNGGQQEKGKRSGTENVAGIVGLAEALKLVNEQLDTHQKRILELRDYFIDRLQTMNTKIKINGDKEKRLPGNINVTFLGHDAQELLFALDEEGICVSAGSACSSLEDTPSHVLTAIGLTSQETEGTLRFSLGKDNTKEEIDTTMKILEKLI